MAGLPAFVAAAGTLGPPRGLGVARERKGEARVREPEAMLRVSAA